LRNDFAVRNCARITAPELKKHKLTILVFDIFYHDYDVSTAHHKVNLLVHLVNYGKRLSYVRVRSLELRERVNVHVANLHNYKDLFRSATNVRDFFVMELTCESVV
jgi:hypothetical protein